MAVPVIMPRQGNTVESCIINEFKKKPGEKSPADVIAAYVGDKEGYIAVVKKSNWYQNMVSKKKPSFDKQIRSAEHKAAEQMNLFENPSSSSLREPSR